MTVQQDSTEKKEHRKRAVLLGVNITLALILTGIALYNPANVDTKFLGFPSAFAPLVYVIVLALFSSKSLTNPRNTYITAGLFVLAAVLLLVPLPEGAQAVKWWYPLTAGLVICLFF